jgi:hypothetical protein
MSCLCCVRAVCAMFAVLCIVNERLCLPCISHRTHHKPHTPHTDKHSTHRTLAQIAKALEEETKSVFLWAFPADGDRTTKGWPAGCSVMATIGRGLRVIKNRGTREGGLCSVIKELERQKQGDEETAQALVADVTPTYPRANTYYPIEFTSEFNKRFLIFLCVRCCVLCCVLCVLCVLSVCCVYPSPVWCICWQRTQPHST